MKRILIGAGVVAVLFIVGYLGPSWYVVNQSLKAEVSPIEERPGDYGLSYEDVEFSPRDWPDITLRGWWVPAEEPKGVVVRVHGVDSNKGTRLGLVRALVDGGYSVFTFDLRGHGESDEAAMGAGLHEVDDVRGAVDYVVAERGAEAGKVFLHGLSFGAAIVLMEGASDSRVGGVFADSSFAALGDMIVQEVGNRTVLPEWAAAALRPGLVWVSRVSRGIDLNAVRPEDAAAEYTYPLGLVHCRADERVVIEHLARIRIALNVPPRLTVYEDCAHGDAWADYTEHYERFVVDYYDELLGLPVDG